MHVSDDSLLQGLSGQFRGALSNVQAIQPPADHRPDDLDLTAMARAGLNYLWGNPEPSRDYECKFSLGPLGIPSHHPTLVGPNQYGYDPVSLADTDSRMDWQYAPMREMAGIAQAEEVERGVRTRILSYQHEDHLVWVNPAAWTGAPIEGLWISRWGSAKLLQSLAESYQRSGDKGTLQEARAIFVQLKALAAWKDGMAYYPGGSSPFRDGVPLREGWCQWHARNYPFIVEPCVRYWECTGDEEALAFARAVADGMMAALQDDLAEQGYDPNTGAFEGHVHLHTHTLWGVAHLGAVLHEPRYLEWARKPYEYVLANGTDYGWYPEHIPQQARRSEVCVVGDMVSLGAWMARGAWPHMWDHVERTVRNLLRVAQFRLTPAFLELHARLHAGKPAKEVQDALAELRRLEGGFVAQQTFNDWVTYPDTLGATGYTRNGICMMGCCPPEGMRALWEAWRGVVEERPEGVFVNLGLQRDHPAAQVRAFQPEDGRLEVTARRNADLFMRPPAWAVREGVRLERDGQETPVTWGGPAAAYVVCQHAAQGERLAITWPVPTFTQNYVPTSVPGLEEMLRVRWVGNTVVGVSPVGEYLPMFPAAE
ncbi:MAG: hypothetical protein ACYC5M_06535 [Anaerolineae bacterium]